MIEPPETVRVKNSKVECDGATDIPGGAALGHPRVWLEIGEEGFVDCGYCDRHFVLIGGPADRADSEDAADLSSGGCKHGLIALYRGT